MCVLLCGLIKLKNVIASSLEGVNDKLHALPVWSFSYGVKEAFSELDGEKIPTVKQLNEEYAELLQNLYTKGNISRCRD